MDVITETEMRGRLTEIDILKKNTHTHLDYSPIVHLISRLAGDATTKGRSRIGHATIYSPTLLLLIEVPTDSW